MFRSILVGTDGSPTAAKAVDRAVALAAGCGAVLTIASVGDEAAEIVEAESLRVADRVAELRTKTLVGNPAEALAAEAEDGYDLLVVGDKGMKGVSRFVTGSVPNRVSHHAPVSLLIVRTT